MLKYSKYDYVLAVRSKPAPCWFCGEPGEWRGWGYNNDPEATNWQCARCGVEWRNTDLENKVVIRTDPWACGSNLD